jgi:hypothetical protein
MSSLRWFQQEHKKARAIHAILPTAPELPFPGLEDFCHRVSDLGAVPPSWRVLLSSVRGAYLLTDRKTGPTIRWQG